MKLARLILRIFGWSVSITVPDYPKCIICVAPHTSNWDFVLGKLAYAAVGRHAGFLMKEAWFFFPMGLFFRAIGGIPVPRRRGSSLVDVVVDKFRSSSRMAVAITPEGTRSRTSQWRTGFLHIARKAGVPIVLGVIDFPSKRIMINEEFHLSGDIEADMHTIKNFYKPFQGKYPDKFTTE